MTKHLNIAIQIFAQDFFIKEIFLSQHVITIKMMEARQRWESMHDHLSWSLDLRCKVLNIILIAFFISQSCFVFVLYNTNIIDYNKYFVLQWEGPYDQGSNPLQSA